MARDRGDANLRRRRGTRAERTRILVVTEGLETEPQYFKGLARTLRATGVEVSTSKVVGLGETPARLVREAAERAGLVRSRRRIEDYDQAWCVLDVDTHETLEEALREAGRLGIRMAVTNPCFELWLLWHFEEVSGHVTVKDLRARLAYHRVTKHLPPGFPYRAYQDAVLRAHATGACQASGVPENPGSGVCELVTVIRTGSRE